MSTTIKKTKIAGLFLIERPVYPDSRGFFHEVFRLNELEEVIGRKFKPVQWGHSHSYPKVVRAIHTEEWQKIVYPVNGRIFAAFVDARPSSKTFGRMESFAFDNDDKNSSHRAVYVAPGIGNSICVVGDKSVDYMYLVDEYWNDSKARGIAWNDPDLAIDWPIKNPIISERDRNNPTLRELYPDRFK